MTQLPWEEDKMEVIQGQIECNWVVWVPSYVWERLFWICIFIIGLIPISLGAIDASEEERMFCVDSQTYQVICSYYVYDRNIFQLEFLKLWIIMAWLCDKGYSLNPLRYVCLNKVHSHSVSWYWNNDRIKNIHLAVHLDLMAVLV